MTAAPLRIWLVSDHCIDPQRSSSQLHVSQVIEGLLRRGHEVACGYLMPPPPRQPAFQAEMAARYPRFTDTGQARRSAIPAFDVLYLTDLWMPHQLRGGLDLLQVLRADAARRFTLVFDSMDCLFKGVGPFLEPAQRQALLDMETQLRAAADHCVMISERECVDGVRAFGLPRERFSVVAQAYDAYAPGLARGHAQRQHLCFVGSVGAPNIEAVEFFIQKVLPGVAAVLPQAEFHIIGAGTERFVFELPPQLQGRVRAVGFVDDIEAAVSGYRVQVVPLLNGAGIKGKLLQSLSCGTPVVSTPKGVEGMDGLGAGACVANTVNDFVQGIVRLYGDAGAWQAQQKAGLDFLRAHYSFARLDAQIDQLLARLPRAAA